MIECTRFKKINKGNLVGFADLYLDKSGMEIYGCTVMNKDGNMFVSLPNKEYKDQQGESKYSPIVRFRNPTHYTEFCKQSLEAVKKKMSEFENQTTKVNEFDMGF